MRVLARRRHTSGALTPLLLIALLALVGCADRTNVAQNTLTTPGAGIAPSHSVAPSAAIEPYSIASSFVGYVETPLSSGSGIRIAPNRLVTNAHVVEPYTEVRVVFGGHEEFPSASVVGVDLIHDIALIALDGTTMGGTTAEPSVAEVTDPLMLPVGSDVFLVGFPGEVESFPVPAISRGIISRHRTWDRTGVGLIQTDADLSGGQSGGALVDPSGAAIGLSSMFFGDSGFAIALSMPDVMRIAQAIENGALQLDPGDRMDRSSMAARVTSTTAAFQIDGIMREATFLYWPPPDAPTEIEVRWDVPVDGPWVEVLDPFGSLIDRWETQAGDEPLVAEFASVGGGPHLVIVGADGIGSGVVAGGAPIAPMIDPDDGITVGRGQTIVAALDAPGERDFYEVRVKKGESSVEVIVDALSFETYVTLEDLDDLDRAMQFGGTWPQNSLGLGSSVLLELDPDRDHRFRVTVGHIEDAVAGAYVLDVR